MMKYPKCRKCGYRYDPMNPDRAVFVITASDGKLYQACSHCIASLAGLTAAETAAAIVEFRVPAVEDDLIGGD